MGSEEVVVEGRAVIETRAPFGSVKEAVLLFGEKVFVPDICAHRPKQMTSSTGTQSREGGGQSELASMTTQLEQTKKKLEKTKQENRSMRRRIKTVRDELEQARKEVEGLKTRADKYEIQKKQSLSSNPEIDQELKFVQDKMLIIHPTDLFDHRSKLQNASVMTPLIGVVNSKEDGRCKAMAIRKKQLLPIFQCFFSTKKHELKPTVVGVEW